MSGLLMPTPPKLYLLDTDICSYLMENRHSVLNDKLRSISPELMAVSAVTQGETWYGYAYKEMGLRRRLAAQAFFESIQVLDWPASATLIYGNLRARLRKSGQDIGLNDTMIAAHAIALDATLITNNTRHLSRIGPPLRIENWLE
jgi:tRNA(fMet)-specific endonuclease VapC